jgi:AcrR family transcriptional regulator
MRREEKKMEILQAAGKVFFLNGFEKTKIEEIARKAGIGKGTVYEYFESKQQLFEELIAYNRRLIISNLQKTLAEGDSIREKLKAFAAFLAGVVKEHMRVFELMAGSRVMAREMGDILLEVVREAVGKEELRADLEPELIASLFVGTVNQFCSKEIVFFMKQPEEINYERLADAVMQGIGQKSEVSA